MTNPAPPPHAKGPSYPCSPICEGYLRERERRAKVKDALRPFADAYHSVIRSGFTGVHSGLMYSPGDPHMLGPTVSDLAPLAAIFDQLVAEDGGSRL